jgi:hypothetical protein
LLNELPTRQKAKFAELYGAQNHTFSLFSDAVNTVDLTFVSEISWEKHDK